MDKRRFLTQAALGAAAMAATPAMAQTKMTDDLGRRGEGTAKPIPAHQGQDHAAVSVAAILAQLHLGAGRQGLLGSRAAP